ncbi:type II toxin-antitoxin system RelE/ParE family toxin [Duganella radicis]|uniref:Killer protein n=1 Tax=Duganella radicis TaxID=551988 RepID=A0A6L6PEL1_9BURK|nr:type II toxin-antitoxin system RelE/ParE family toxin [Duganella radicis]MTV37470.1 Killer protein [Duganella radicis]
MSLHSTDIMHKGMRRFWQSGGSDKRGISTSWAKPLRDILLHLHSAQSLDDIRAGLGVIKNVKQLSGHAHRYSIEVNANWRVTFDCADPDTGIVTAIDLEDLHRPGGARRH